MATSPRSSWTGTLQLGLLSVPVSLAPATNDQREQSLKQLCGCHKQPIDGSHRCSVTGSPPDSKVKGVEDSKGKWRVLSEHDLAGIEDATKSKELVIEESQPLENLPMQFSQGTYFVRAEKDNRAAAQSYKILHEAVKASGKGLVAKWGSSARQRLVVIHADHEKLLLTKLPMHAELREPGTQELAHLESEVPQKAVEMATTLIEQYETPEFTYESYTDEGLALRQKAVDKILAGEKVEVPVEKKEEADDIMAQLQASMDAVKAKA